ncbi:3-hydroxyisobutyryl-CoA hydrolase, mitochondrial-like [Tigriopus californicus]|uniref:3-hydroxyisobutyryl-CoA hydrolase, mitochondrial-like n=1 Tax=Tigriopus californicus TaxID=6832 RepID=UPI0027DA692C|nr:3-hydroxyisobutyryl-CoA hydrolase, mitochondrial-like [Tigriopus californicus]
MKVCQIYIFFPKYTESVDALAYLYTYTSIHRCSLYIKYNQQFDTSCCSMLFYPVPRLVSPCVSRVLQPSFRAMSSSPEVTFKVVKDAGIITLNRPKVLNALTFPMIRLIYPQLKQWQDQLKMVIIEGSGEKAFCAGGDIRAITSIRGSEDQTAFFKEEYVLNNLIGSFKIPYIALIDGITMGGGVGLSVHGKYRIASERTMFAMPETGIGLIPDVGGGYFLPRLPGELGMYLALMGHRLKGADCVHAGVATHGCESGQFPQLKEDLLNVKDTQEINAILEKYSKAFMSQQTAFSLESKLDAINECFSSREGVLDIVKRLEAFQSDPEWAQKELKTLGRLSPTSLAVTFRQMRTGGKLKTLGEVLEMEYRLVCRCCEDHDFYEGVRALLVDKDNAPQWQPKSISEVTTERVDHYFSPLGGKRDLKLGPTPKM